MCVRILSMSQQLSMRTNIAVLLPPKFTYACMSLGAIQDDGRRMHILRHGSMYFEVYACMSLAAIQTTTDVALPTSSHEIVVIISAAAAASPPTAAASAYVVHVVIRRL